MRSSEAPTIGLLLLGACQAAAPAPEPVDPPVLVIGAGLAAARALQDAGLDVVVLEARDRIGGRAHTRDVGGVPVDAGAMLVHGVGDNPLATLCDALGIAYEPAGFGMGPIHDAATGGPVEDGLLQLARATRDFENRLEDLAAALPADASMRDAIEAFLDGSGERSEDQRRYASFALTQLLIELYEAGPADLMSLRAYVESPYAEFAGGNHVLPGGYVQVVDALAEGLDVRLNEPVSRISYDAAGVTVSTPSGELRGSHAIVTVPLGVLKAGVIAFDPPLSASKRAAIERLDMGNLEKVVLRFDEPFWRERGASSTFLYVAEEPGEFPGFTDWTDAAGAPTLVCVYGGRSARNVLDKWGDEEIATRAVQTLREIFGDDVPDPIATHVTRWRDDPWTLGSYGYLPVGSGPDDMRELGEPVEGRLLFAGEATEPLLYATVHGALVSGLREARRIAGDAAALPGIDGTARRRPPALPRRLP